MNATDRLFVKIIHNYINGKSCEDIDFSQLEEEQFKSLVRKHKVVGIVYSQLKNAKVSNELIKYLEPGFFTQISSYQKRCLAKENLKVLFNKEGIKHIWIKGSHISDMYPNPEFRSMSDLDIIVEPESMDKVIELLQKMKAEYKREISETTVSAYKLYGVNLELHTSLVSEILCMNDTDYAGYFKGVFDNVICQDGCAYILNNEYNIVYNIFHIAKHFYGSGCGIRMIMDLPIMIKGMGELDWDKIWTELNKLNLSGFATKILMLSEDWFGQYGVIYKGYVEETNIEVIEDYIINGGVYGMAGKNTAAVQISNHSGKDKGKKGYITGVLRWAFPSYKEMRLYSEWFENKPAVLLPVAYLERFYRNSKERGGVIKWGKNIISAKNEINDKIDILNIMELK